MRNAENKGIRVRWNVNLLRYYTGICRSDTCTAFRTCYAYQQQKIKCLVTCHGVHIVFGGLDIGDNLLCREYILSFPHLFNLIFSSESSLAQQNAKVFYFVDLHLQNKIKRAWAKCIAAAHNKTERWGVGLAEAKHTPSACLYLRRSTQRQAQSKAPCPFTLWQ